MVENGRAMDTVCDDLDGFEERFLVKRSSPVVVRLVSGMDLVPFRLVLVF